MYLTHSGCEYQSSANVRKKNKIHTKTNEGAKEGQKIMERLPSPPGPESEKGQGKGKWPFPEARGKVSHMLSYRSRASVSVILKGKYAAPAAMTYIIYVASILVHIYLII